MGYSDITALLLAVNTKTHLVTFHGPIAGGEWDAFTKKYFEAVAMKNSKGVLLDEYFPVIDEDENIARLPARFRARALAQNGLHAAATQAADNHGQCCAIRASRARPTRGLADR